MKSDLIVITGGPCAGKSSALCAIQRHFEKLGYTVLVVCETATELIGGGVAPWTCGSNVDYQIGQMRLQMEKERVFERAARTMSADKILIVCDRGALDNRAYMTEAEFQKVLWELDVNEVTLRDHYDAVFHLVTAARGAEAFYTTANNTARTETPEQARALDDRIIAAWTGHPHFRVIDNSTDFEGKIQRLIAEISVYLGEPEPFEIERRFLIRYPDVEWLTKHPACRRVDIVQTYVQPDHEERFRLRQRGYNGSYVYFLTRKKSVSPIKRIELENRLTREEYQAYLSGEGRKTQLAKSRYCLTYKDQYFEIDVYPFWTDQAIMEIELRSEDQPVILPEGIDVIREITGDRSLNNSALAEEYGVTL
ncbi:MAG: AAA family ATPase [Clostridia bacterium]|nr:AAA family ATPase [Clostridia bacterium]